mgnify:FL=1|jgi:polyferredoxin
MSESEIDSTERFLQGEQEPDASWVFLALGMVATFSFLVMFSLLYPGQELPVISSVLPIFSGIFDSGIWFFIFGIMIGAFSIVGTLLLEATSE